MKAKFDFLLHHFFCFGVMLLFTIAGDLCPVDTFFFMYQFDPDFFQLNLYLFLILTFFI